MIKLPKSSNLKFLGFNVKMELLQKLNEQSKKKECSRSFLLNDIIETYFELLDEVTRGVSYEN